MEYKDRRLTPRYSFVADIEVTDVESEARIKGRVKDLSLSGCGVKTFSFFPKGRRVRIKLFHGGGYIEALGTVAYGRLELGMGVEFTSVEAEDERILAGWIAELKSVQTAHA
jgi:hypothetical protein